MKWLIALLTLFSVLFAEEIEEPIDIQASKEVVVDQRENYFQTSTSYKIAPKVNPITGDLIEEEEDLIIAGCEPISLRRFYSHTAAYEPRYGCWRYNPETYLVANFEWSHQERFAAAGDVDGSIASFKPSSASPHQYTFDKPKGFSNTNPGGQFHPLNTKITYDKIGDPKNKYRFLWKGEITDGNGAKRQFTSPMHTWLRDIRHKKGPKTLLEPGVTIIYKITPNVWTPYQIPVTETKLPNGNILCYAYVRWKDDKLYPKPPLLRAITAYNADKSKMLGQIIIDYRKDKREDVLGLTATGSDGRKTTIAHIGKSPILLHSVATPDKPSCTYRYQNTCINQVEKPEGRLITTHYDGAGKVSSQCAPVGPNGESVPIVRYVYHGNHATEVFDAEGHETIYRFNEHKQVHTFETYKGKTLYRAERMTWDDKGNLVRKTVEDGTGKVFQITELIYDKNQNPIEEKVGDGAHWCALHRTFSDDGFNLKLTESDCDGKLIRYSYRPGTNLLISELVYEGSKIRKRTFHEYDDCAICVKTIIDDGSSTDATDFQGVTYRKITEITPKSALPCFGLPEVVQEKTIDHSGKEILLKKVIYTYAPSGKILREEHYDAENKHCYTIENTYDARERLISTIDPLGHRLHFTYDENNNMTSIAGPRPEQLREIVYDKANRPIRISERQPDGTVLTTEKKYDKLGQIIAEIDACGNETRYEYDALGRIVTTYYADGAVERKEYDIFDNVTKEIDANGYETTATYDFHNKPLFIQHPDRSMERFTYNERGALIAHLDKNGAQSNYEYDLFDHVIRTIVKGGMFKSKTSLYTPFCQLSETDAQGVTTRFFYDFCGRKIAEEVGNKKTTYSYDSRGFLAEANSQFFRTVERHDDAGNLISHRIEDLSGGLQFQEEYEYDEAKNRTKVITPRGVFETSYNTLKKPLVVKDPVGAVTTHEYCFGKEYKEITKQPSGITIVHIFDARGREIEMHRKNKNGELFAKQIYCYDKGGNRTEITHFVFDGINLIKTVTHHWDYGPAGRVERFIEAGKKETRYVYDAEGRLITTVKPSGVQLHRKWDVLGRLSRFSSNDFDYQYTYDRSDRLLNVVDSISKTKTTRSYDTLGNLVQETLANGFKIANAFDEQGRRICVTLPDESKIQYECHGAYLCRVSRNGQICSYIRDTQGLVSQVKLPHELGTIDIKRDPLCRWTQCESPYYRETFGKGAYDLQGNLLKYQYKDPEGVVECAYAYDDLNQLISENDHKYSFDSLHNRLKKDDLSYQVNDLCQVVGDGCATYEYDDDGNMIFDGKCRYVYDTQNRLTSAENGTLRIEYEYDSFNRRLSKKTKDAKKNTIERYLWDGDNEIGIGDAQGKIEQLRVIGEGLGAEIGAAVLYEIKGRSYVPIHDHRGCVVVLIDTKTKKPIENYRYTAFGEELTKGRLSPWRFSSKRVDNELGLVFFGRRYYNPKLGRWITQDPQGFEGGPNLYAYVTNCPLNRFDLYGLLGIGQCFNAFSHMVFRTLEWTGANLLPIPYARNVVESIGRWGAGGEFCGASRYRTGKSEIITIPGRTIPGHTYTHGNGMLTSKTDAIKQAEYISKTHGNIQVDLLYHGTEGLVMDLLGCGLSKLGIPTSYNTMCANYYQRKLLEDPNYLFTSSVHSRGGIQMMNTGRFLTPEQRQHINVISYGSATLIPRRYFKDCENNVTSLDFIAMTNPLAYGIGLVSNKQFNMHFLSPLTRCPLKAHGFLEATYAEEIERRGDAFKELYFNE